MKNLSVLKMFLFRVCFFFSGSENQCLKRIRFLKIVMFLFLFLVFLNRLYTKLTCQFLTKIMFLFFRFLQNLAFLKNLVLFKQSTQLKWHLPTGRCLCASNSVRLLTRRRLWCGPINSLSSARSHLSFQAACL